MSSRSGAASFPFGKVPAVDIVEKEKEYEITAELPGMDEKNIDVKFRGYSLVKGEV
jgi:HSP20 family protein